MTEYIAALLRRWSENAWILSHALLPLVIQQVSHSAFPNYRWPFGLAYFFYLFNLSRFALGAVTRLNSPSAPSPPHPTPSAPPCGADRPAGADFAVKFGTFDEKNIGRDRTPDKSVANLAKGIIAYMIVRTAFSLYLCYDAQVPNLLTDLHWYFPLKLALWEVTMDYFFYVRVHHSSVPHQRND